MSNDLEIELRPGLIGRKRKLFITPDYLEYESKDLGDGLLTKIKVDAFCDVKYETHYIVWYKFTVGYSYKIYIKYDYDKVLTIRFANYITGYRKHGEYFTEITKRIGNYFLRHVIKEKFDALQANGSLKLNGVEITRESVSNKQTTITLSNVALKEYYSYFVIYNTNNPTDHIRISFNEWESELLFNCVKAIIAHQKN
jgi:hypothetical protein